MQAPHQAMLASIAADALLVRLLPASGHGALICAAGYSSSASPARTVEHTRQGLFDLEINQAPIIFGVTTTHRLCAAATAVLMQVTCPRCLACQRGLC